MVVARPAWLSLFFDEQLHRVCDVCCTHVIQSNLEQPRKLQVLSLPCAYLESSFDPPQGTTLPRKLFGQYRQAGGEFSLYVDF